MNRDSELTRSSSRQKIRCHLSEQSLVFSGQYVLAGFNGHGMARILVVHLVYHKWSSGGKWEDTGMPECFQITEERMAKLRQ